MDKIKKLIDNLYQCGRIAFASSILYSILRILARMLLPLISLSNAFILKKIVDILISSYTMDEKTQIIILYFIIMILISLVQSIIGKAAMYAESIHQDIISRFLQQNIMKKALESDYALFDNPDFYDRLALATSDSNSFVSLIWVFFDFLSATLSFIVTTVVISIYNPLFALITTVLAIPAAIVKYIYTNKMYRLEQKQINENRRKNYLFHVSTTKEFASSIRLYGIESYLNEKYKNEWQAIFFKKKLLVKKESFQTLILESMPTVAILIFSFLIAKSVIKNNITLGDYTLYAGQLNQLLTSVMLIINNLATINDNSLRIENVKTFYKIPNQIVDSGIQGLDTVYSIEFAHVSFIYPETKNYVLRDVDFFLKKGESIALVGVNGSGKSTLIKLLLRFYDPTEGIIYINGINIQEYSLKELRSSISCYFQNELNYSFTIKENLDIAQSVNKFKHKGIADSTRELDYQASMHKASFDDTINKASDGINTYVTKLFNPHGMEMSGGEHQRLALSRMFYRGGEIIILDEPSSALDPEAENHLFNNLKTFANNRILIFTSHRLPNISIATKIIVLENGVIIEQGTKEQLLKNNGRFSVLYSYQTDNC